MKVKRKEKLFIWKNLEFISCAPNVSLTAVKFYINVDVYNDRECKSLSTEFNLHTECIVVCIINLLYPCVYIYFIQIILFNEFFKI